VSPVLIEAAKAVDEIANIAAEKIAMAVMAGKDVRKRIVISGINR
jgi:hypothetical protein